jgi:hypothetical protein
MIIIFHYRPQYSFAKLFAQAIILTEKA